MNWFYVLLLIFVVSCNGDNNVNGGNVNLPVNQEEVENQFSGEEFFSIQRATTDPVQLTFNKRSGSPVTVSLEQGECVYIAVSQYADMDIAVGNPLFGLCGYATSCIHGNYKIVDGSPRRASTEKLNGCLFVSM